MLARASHGYLGAGKVCDLFPVAHTTFLSGKPSSKWLCLQCMGRAASRPTRPCHSSQAQKSAPEAKGVSQLKVQAAYKDRQEELETTALPEA